MRGFHATGLLGISVIAAGALLWGSYYLFPAANPSAALGDADNAQVTILVIRDKNLFSDVRASIEPTRVVAEGEGAFALAEGRVVALAPAYAGPLLTQLGWGEHEVELIDTASLGGRDPRRLHQRASRARSGGRGSAVDLNALAAKKTLSLNEAIRVLDRTH